MNEHVAKRDDLRERYGCSEHLVALVAVEYPAVKRAMRSAARLASQRYFAARSPSIALGHRVKRTLFGLNAAPEIGILERWFR